MQSSDPVIQQNPFKSNEISTIIDDYDYPILHDLALIVSSKNKQWYMCLQK